MDFERARFNMVEQQIRPWEVVNPEVRRLLMAVRREDYVPPGMRSLAFADIEIPLPCGQFMLRPPIEGRILQAVGVSRVGSVLEIGTGSGYFAALLSTHVDRVFTVEIEPELAQLARNNLARHGIHNVTVEEGDASKGWFAQAPYDEIIVSGGFTELPKELLAQLKPGGRLFAFIGKPPVMKAHKIVRLNESMLQDYSIFETVVPMLARPLGVSRSGF